MKAQYRTRIEKKKQNCAFLFKTIIGLLRGAEEIFSLI